MAGRGYQASERLIAAVAGVGLSSMSSLAISVALSRWYFCQPRYDAQIGDLDLPVVVAQPSVAQRHQHVVELVGGGASGRRRLMRLKHSSSLGSPLRSPLDLLAQAAHAEQLELGGVLLFELGEIGLRVGPMLDAPQRVGSGVAVDLFELGMLGKVAGERLVVRAPAALVGASLALRCAAQHHERDADLQLVDEMSAAHDAGRRLFAFANRHIVGDVDVDRAWEMKIA